MYYFVYALFYCLSLLPFWAMYAFGSVLNFIVYTVFGYRKKVVYANIRNSFPDKSELEIKQIAKRFYLSFTDQWLETVKLMSMTDKQINKRISCNWDFLSQYNTRNQPVYVVLGHRFNWEWANVAFAINSTLPMVGLYLPLSSKVFDRLMLKIRSRFGATYVPVTNMLPGLKKMEGKNYLMGFLADQTPSNLNLSIWYNFLNQPTPFITGPEKAAKRAGAAVVYLSISKRNRGYYTIEMEEICANAKDMPYGYITKACTKRLQDEMLQQPENWLWSHRRWKRKPTVNEKIIDLD